ncbi:MAG: glycosyltransferase family 2 protein [Bacteroidales bacterium]|jgi:glycosyltransferase involved in cell wall biosynthesis|nr:glycosyltransferase family 2 protein [Bacteroidales bacterium]
MTDLCVIIPAYNNCASLAATVDATLEYASRVIVVNDGSTDGTAELLSAYETRVDVISYPVNKGKGYALSKGFDRAETLGFSHAVTMDADGQHSAADLPLFAEVAARHPDAMIIGSRLLKQENKPKKNIFANRFSNFWFTVMAGRRLPDTQTGFRLYPLAAMSGMRPFTSRYEAELELMVRISWRNIPQIPVPVTVRYTLQRVTHFRPFTDFMRISLLNACMVIAAIFYGYPSKAWMKLKMKR